MSEKPEKRLVGWLEYLEQASEKALGHAFASAFGCVGVVLLLWSIFGIVAGGEHVFYRNIGYAIFLWTGSAVVAGLGLGALWCAKCLFREAKQLPPVALFTKASLNRLSEVETLVRPSDLPVSHQQAELLRAATASSETPAEELLRATTNKQGD